MKSIDIPISWQRSAEKIIQEGLRKILIIGPLDSGKSTYCQFLSERIMDEGHRVAILDADIGQKDIGPPACLSLGLPGSPGSLNGLKPSSIYFIGAVSPLHHLLPMVVGTKQLADLAADSFTIINTTGFIKGTGRILKSFKIEMIKPDLIIAIQRESELISILNSYRHFKTFRIKVSPKARAKSFEERKEARARAFRTYFQDAPDISVELRGKIFQRSLILTGNKINDPFFPHVEKTSEGVVAVSSDEFIESDIKVVRKGFEKNLLCGLTDKKSPGLGLAILKEIDFESDCIDLITPVPPHQIDIIQLGNMYISRSGEELGWRKHGEF